MSATVPTDASSSPGTIIDSTGRLIVAAGDGPLEVLELQPAGKRSMPAAEFVRGYRPAAGDTFGSA
jgi:methionyl-tRNA formyltransferase